MISERAKRVDASGIRKVFELAAKIEDPINLSIGQPDFDVPETAKEAAIRSIREGHNRYTLTQGIPELRDKIIEKLEKTRSKHYEKNEVLIASGVSGALFLALISIINPGDEIVFFDPYFVMYKHLVNLLDGKPVIIDTYPDFRIDREKLEAAITPRTKAILLNSPTNPTGVVASREDIEAVVAVAKKHNLLLISDEIYDGFVYDGDFQSPASSYDKCMVLGGFSKSYAMTGWRLGYAAGPADLIAEMTKIQQYTFVCAPTPFQYAAITALDIDMTKTREAYKQKRDLIYQGLKDSFNVVKPGGAFYIFPGLKNTTRGDASAVVEKVIQKSALIIPGNVFSEKNTHFRISFASDNETLKRGIEILNQTAKDWQ